MSQMINSTIVVQDGIGHEVLLSRSETKTVMLTIYELSGDVLRASKLEQVSVDKNPELFNLYNWKANRFNRDEVVNFVRAVREARECSQT